MSGGAAGDKPPTLDQDGKMINPHNPEFITKVPWYLGDTGPTLKHHSVQNNNRELSITETDALIAKKLAAQSEILQSSKRTTYRKGACKNCGAMTHQEKDCLDRPRSMKKMAWKSGLDIAADEVVLDLEQHGKLSYAAKRDQWKGFDPTEYQEIVERHNRLEEERKKLMEAERLAKVAAQESDVLAKKQAKALRKSKRSTNVTNTDGGGAGGEEEMNRSDYSDASDSDIEDSDDDYADIDDGVKASDANTRDFQGTLIPQGGVGGNGMRITSRNLRIREDTPKYLRNLSLDSAFYDPKSRSMRANPYGNNTNPEDLPFAGDNFVRITGDAVELAKNQVLCWEMAEKGAIPEHLAALGGAGMIDVIANPSQSEYLKRQFDLKKKDVEEAKKKAIYAKYLGEEYVQQMEENANKNNNNSNSTSNTNGSSGNSSGQKTAMLPPKGLDIRLRLGQTETYVEYDREGRVIKGPSAHTKNSTSSNPLVSSVTKYEEDAFPLNHTSVWGSFYSRSRACWGYACCHATMKNAYCTGSTGKAANDAAMMQEGQHIARNHAKETVNQQRKPVSLFSSSDNSSSNGHNNGTNTSAVKEQEEDLEMSEKDKQKLLAMKQRFENNNKNNNNTAGHKRGLEQNSSNSSDARDEDGNRVEEGDSSGNKDMKKRAKLAATSTNTTSSFVAPSSMFGEMSEKDMEEYRKKRIQHEDPMAAFLSNPDVLLDR